jgi:hypothetical protein
MAFIRLSTSQKLILVLTIALMPLGAVALLVSLQSARTADKQRRVDTQIAATEAARKLSAELTSDILALSQAANALEIEPRGVGPCERLNAQLAANPMRHTPVALFGAGSSPVCASKKITDQRPVVALTWSISSCRRGAAQASRWLGIVVPSLQVLHGQAASPSPTA